MPLLIFAITLFPVSYLLSHLGLDSAYLTVMDIQYLVVSMAVVPLCMGKKMGYKVIALMNLLFSAVFTLFNLFVDYDILQSIDLNWSIFIGLLSLLCLIGFVFMHRWSNIRSDKIEPGYIYEISGLPRTIIQCVCFLITLGKGGSFAVTDGETCIYMNYQKNKSVKEPLSHSYLIGKKCVKLCKATDENIDIYNSKVNKEFHWWYNCYMLCRGFRR